MPMPTTSEFFKNQSEPHGLDQIKETVKSFLKINENKRVVLVTSGGTTVPLEAQTVRFLDNFSAGTRGATSAEYFIENGYAVLFLHRQFSLEPYTRQYTHSKNCFLDLLQFNQDEICVDAQHKAGIQRILGLYQKAKQDSLLLKIGFTTVSEYLFLLRSLALLLVPFGRRAFFYLAAAVSDFYIPEANMVLHKIQSGDSGLHLDLEQVPKVIKPLVQEWNLNAFTVSFKLETDPEILIPKSKAALTRYGHTVVVANLLETRKFIVWVVSSTDQHEIRLTENQLSEGVEIEKFIVNELVAKHTAWCEISP